MLLVAVLVAVTHAMASFNEDSLKKKLDDLNMSQQSIQTVSLWLIHHKKHAHTVVNVWCRELITGELLAMIFYLHS